MAESIPSVADIKAALVPLTLRQLNRLSELSGVPATTIYKIRRGETGNPGIETVRLFAPHIAAAALEARDVAAPVLEVRNAA